MPQKAIFLDRDGTVIVDKHYLNDPQQVEFLPAAIEGLKLFKQQGFALVVVTNQSGVARGLVQEENILKIHQRMQEILLRENIQIDGFYYAPQAADSNHPMRKPNPGMLIQAAKDLRLSLDASFMIGDKDIDVEAGHRAGCKSILVSTIQKETTADFCTQNLLEAALCIKKQT